MNREDRSKFLALIEQHNRALLDGVDRDRADDETIMRLVGQAMTPLPATGALVVYGGAGGPSLPVGDLVTLCQAHGQTYRDHVRVDETRPDGTTRRVWQTRLRPIEASDILSHRVNGSEVVVVTADGQKRTLARTGAGDAEP